jgi:hypothetical protein
MAKTVKPKMRADAGVISLKVTLKGMKPPVWRRLLMPGGTTLRDLHRAILAAMGWGGGHLHLFDIDGREYGDRRDTDDVADENRLTLNGLLRSGVARFGYVYDFGDNWQHAILIERTMPASDAIPCPACVDGRRACPPDDCGGPWGYRDLLEVLADPARPQHAEQREWVGEDFDPEAFDVTAADASVAALFNRR